MVDSKTIIEELEKHLKTITPAGIKEQNIGIVEQNHDGVITASGLSKAFLGEILEFQKGGSGVVFNLDEDTVSIISLTAGEDIVEGDVLKKTNRLLSVSVSNDLLGRVINPLGEPLDGKLRIKNGKFMPLEKIAAGVIQREPVNTPLKTGIKAIDTMIPIGRGQRELIIGDRGLGKTAIAVDTIINQRNKDLDLEQVICVYVAIGQKRSTIAQIIQRLADEKALAYSIIVAASASEPAALQYLAPYAGAAIAEYFLEKGKDVLVIYDDLTKHAWAYRQISLVLGRPAGREAYPGDIFYLHSRLLERAVKLNKKNGGGSITALPIIETQAGDLSAYIPTNVISITDGQIFLQGDLFNIGVRPAINIGNSVSRVGGSALSPALKSIASRMRLDLAQYNALAAFAQFGSELDPATIQQLERGKRTTEILKQPQYKPLPESYEILSIWAVSNGYMDDIPVDQIQRFEKELYEYVQTRKSLVIKELSTGKKPNDETLKQMEKLLKDFKKGFSV